jgi:hypothetical protein
MAVMSRNEPFAIAMWDFSWLERRWPGAGYEDWGRALDELAERGYNAVRIDAYPHLVAAGAERSWDLLPQWNQQSWGAQSAITVRVLPELAEFIAAARDRGISVALSTWFRKDSADLRMRITTPQKLADIWIATLDALESRGVLDNVLYVDLCNEFPMPYWAPFLYGVAQGLGYDRSHPEVTRWFNDTISTIKAARPEFEYTFSFAMQLDTWREQDVSALDFLEPHVWMAGGSTTDFYDRVGYGFEQFTSTGYDNLVKRGEEVYRSNQERYDTSLMAEIDNVADWSRATGKSLVTTECWSIVDYKDWPGLDWGWVKDLNARAVEHAVGTGRWLGVATSNFCGPQFVGMWRDLSYHQRLTTLIRTSTLDLDLRSGERPT